MEMREITETVDITDSPESTAILGKRQQDGGVKYA